MATTRELNLTQQWTRCATGDGDVCVTGADEVLWVVTDAATTPALTYGHLARTGDLVSMRLVAGEHLWLKGNGGAVVTADHPVDVAPAPSAMLFADDDFSVITADDDTTPIEAA